eukprot:10561-Pleurochrysis_carterae.AAC.2
MKEDRSMLLRLMMTLMLKMVMVILQQFPAAKRVPQSLTVRAHAHSRGAQTLWYAMRMLASASARFDGIRGGDCSHGNMILRYMHGHVDACVRVSARGDVGMGERAWVGECVFVCVHARVRARACLCFEGVAGVGCRHERRDELLCRRLMMMIVMLMIRSGGLLPHGCAQAEERPQKKRSTHKGS